MDQIIRAIGEIELELCQNIIKHFNKGVGIRGITSLFSNVEIKEHFKEEDHN